MALKAPPRRPRRAPATKRPAAPVPPILGLIGNTPLMPLFFHAEGLTIYAKAEFTNPSGSIKDRLAHYLLANARKRGLLRPDSVILECTSGNTGISLAMVGAALGHQVKILMSETASIERRHLMTQLGAELELFKADRGYVTGIEIAEKMARADRRYFLPRQFENPLNARDHEEHTGVEILAQMRGRVDAFVSGYGTGGTLRGVSRALRAARPGVRIVAMEPAEAAMLSGESPCCHSIEGIAGGFVPPLLRGLKLDAKEKIGSEAALGMTRRLAREFGLLVGTSSGANVCAALRTAAQLPRGARVVTILCDRAERYYSTRLFARSGACRL
jgi:cysteine synthase A